jgi:hypothetical protein
MDSFTCPCLLGALLPRYEISLGCRNCVVVPGSASACTVIECPGCDLLFLDFEASSLRTHSYPIELGWSAWDSGETGSLLIRPEEIWWPFDWDPTAEALHGISRDLIACDGVSASCAADVILGLARGRQIVSDQLPWDGPWLNRLLSSIGEAPRRVIDFDFICWQETARLFPDGEPQGMEISVQQARLACYGERERAIAGWPEIRHRAGPDARRIHAGYAAVRLAVDRCSAKWRG